MTPRERVLAAISHCEPDRTPLFERLIKSPHSDTLLGRPCLATQFDAQMRMLADGAHGEMCLQQARDIVDLAKMLGFDMVAAGPNGGPPADRPQRVAPGRWRVGGSIGFVNSSGWVQWESVTPSVPREPITDDQEAAELAAGLETPFTPSEDPDGFVVFREVRRIIEEERLDLAIYSSCYGMPVCTLSPTQLIWLHTRPELMHSFYRRCSDGVLHLVRQCIASGADIIGLGGDMASDAGPFVSPRHYREFVMPEIRRQADEVHRLGAYATNTSDGNLWPVIDDFLIATDVDGFGEIDYVAGMDLRKLKERFGQRICLIGNLDIRFILTRGAVDECRAHTRDCIEAGWGSGGHILMTSNVVHEDVRLGNYLACIDAYRGYFGL